MSTPDMQQLKARVEAERQKLADRRTALAALKAKVELPDSERQALVRDAADGDATAKKRLAELKRDRLAAEDAVDLIAATEARVRDLEADLEAARRREIETRLQALESKRKALAPGVDRAADVLAERMDAVYAVEVEADRLRAELGSPSQHSSRILRLLHSAVKHRLGFERVVGGAARRGWAAIEGWTAEPPASEAAQQ